MISVKLPHRVLKIHLLERENQTIIWNLLPMNIRGSLICFHVFVLSGRS